MRSLIGACVNDVEVARHLCVLNNNRPFAWWRHFTTKTTMLCQNAFLFNFVFSLGYKETIGKNSLTIEATNGILVLVVKWRHRAKGLLSDVEQTAAIKSIIYRSRRVRQIIDLRHTDKSRSFAMTMFNNCFISFTKPKKSKHFLTPWGTDLPFSHKSVVAIMQEQNIICSKTLIIRQLFSGHVVRSQPMKTYRFV